MSFAATEKQALFAVGYYGSNEKRSVVLGLWKKIVKMASAIGFSDSQQLSPN